MHTDNVLENVKIEGERSAREAAFSPLVETLTRIGFGARGLLYFVMGLIAVQVVLGGSGTTADKQGALAAIGAQPVGRVLLWIVLVGLVGYSLWGIIRALFDPLHVGKDWSGIVQRAGFLISAVSYGSLILPTYGLLTGGGQRAQNGAQTAQTQSFVSSLMATSSGRWIVAFVGVVIIGVGLAHIYKGLSRRFDKQFQLYDLSYHRATWIRRLGRVGTAARGFVFGLVGAFLAVAAYQANPSQAQGINGALLKLLALPYGPWLLGVVAVGLIAFGIYSMTGALWIRFKHR